MNNKIFKKFIVLILFMLILVQGCSYLAEKEILSVGKKFHGYIKNKNYKKAFRLHVKIITDEELANNFNEYIPRRNYVTFENFKKNIRYDQPYYEKKIKSIKINDSKMPRVKEIQFILGDIKDGIIILYIKKNKKNNWKILGAGVIVS